MRLSLIAEEDLKSLLNRYQRDTYNNLEKILDGIGVPDDRKASIFNEMRRAVLESDLTEDQRYWQRLAQQLGVTDIGPGSPFRRSLTKALEVVKREKIEDSEEDREETKPEDEASYGGGILSGLKSAMTLYLQAYARQHGLSMPGGENNTSKNIKVLEIFFSELIKFVK